MQHTVNLVKLKNGAEGLFIDVPGASVTAYDLVFRAGDYLSPVGKTDTAHIMEHLVLGANKKYPSSREFSKEFTKYGAYNNAYTGDYHMGYEAECEASESERVLDLLCVAVESLLFSQTDFDAEVGNVREELKMRRNNDDVELSLKLEDVLGLVPKSYAERETELGNISLKDVEAHYAKTHKASNLRFVIAGPIGNLQAKLQRRLEQLDLDKGNGIIELPNERPSNLTDVLLVENANLDNVCYRWEQIMPQFTTDLQRDSLNALFDILFNGFHSRVFGDLRERGLAYGIFSSYYDTKNNTISVINGQVQAGNITEVFGILNKELSDVAKNGVTEQELIDLRRRAYGEVQRHHQTVAQISSWYRYVYTMRGEVDDYANFKQRLDAVTIDTVKQAASGLLGSKIKGLGIMYNPQQKLDVANIEQALLAK